MTPWYRATLAVVPDRVAGHGGGRRHHHRLVCRARFRRTGGGRLLPAGPGDQPGSDARRQVARELGLVSAGRSWPVSEPAIGVRVEIAIARCDSASEELQLRLVHPGRPDADGSALLKSGSAIDPDERRAVTGEALTAPASVNAGPVTWQVALEARDWRVDDSLTASRGGRFTLQARLPRTYLRVPDGSRLPRDSGPDARRLAKDSSRAYGRAGQRRSRPLIVATLWGGVRMRQRMALLRLGSLHQQWSTSPRLALHPACDPPRPPGTLR